MSRPPLAVALAIALSTPLAAPAGLITADWSWTGDAGWSAGGVVTWDDTIAFPAASGAGTSGGLRNTGIDYLDVALYRPSGASAGAWVNIRDGNVLGRHVLATIDSAALDFALGSTLNVGDVAWAQVARLSIILGTGGAIVINSSIMDRGPGAVSFVLRQPPPDPTPDPTPIAVPAPLALIGLGLALLGWRRRHA
jgi:MYXO-CTERM domain-containing protein